MSTQRGNTTKQRAQKHKNGHSFKNDKYDTSIKQKTINNLHVSNVCQRCKDCIEWKIKYKKYKPLTVPGKCVKCCERKVKYAYHIVCTDCAVQNKVCAKCSKQKDVVDEPEKPMKEQQQEENYLKEELKYMKLREKRTFLRKLEKDQTTDIEKVDNSEDDDSINDDANDDVNDSGICEASDVT
ncbi:uncharacterized protein C9orf85 homolog [Hydractinia symbiolongicarpus]|uniref:uncharacterized protein C9orf85 homolog n=1 Tax=Hydractinia symbiolongicarpus TaxID=13093 RepID=UPI0025514532|nr:uncharacterized protein C9orf85 homolog [Hydractinia symbiolongicarpus]